MSFAVEPPIEPMLAKLADDLPVGPYLYGFMRRMRPERPDPSTICGL